MLVKKKFFSLSMTQHFNDRLPPRRRTKLLIKLVFILKKKLFFFITDTRDKASI